MSGISDWAGGHLKAIANPLNVKGHLTGGWSVEKDIEKQKQAKLDKQVDEDWNALYKPVTPIAVDNSSSQEEIGRRKRVAASSSALLASTGASGLLG